MKAIYINLDPYLAAFAAWVNGGKVGTKPDCQPLPLAVTVPLGQSVAIAIPYNDGNETNPVIVNVGGESVPFDIVPSYSGDVIETGVRLGLSAYDSVSYPALYNICTVSGDSATVQIPITDEDGNTITIPFTVLVRREQASGPVDLVDFTPPAAAPSAADIKSALVAAGAGALDGVDIYGSIFNNENILSGEADGKTVLCVGAS